MSATLSQLYCSTIQDATPTGTPVGQCLDALVALLAAYIYSACPPETRAQAVDMACDQLTELVAGMGAAGL
jgi:hypothetical protein